MPNTAIQLNDESELSQRITVFQTPGIFDIVGLTTFGLNEKPNSDSPIGYFGTGLKYAIAVLLREGAHVTIYAGFMHYELYTKEYDYRGTKTLFAMLKKRHIEDSKPGEWVYSKLPFTLELGKNWELWQAYRELMSNTKDENGDAYCTDEEIALAENSSFFIIEHDEFASIHEDEHAEVFLETGDPLHVYNGVEAYEGRSKYVYYKGVRAYELESPSRFTYNFIRDMELTEDRTLKDFWWVKHRIMQMIVHSGNRTIMAASIEKSEGFEASLDFDTYVSSNEFFSVVKSIPISQRLPRINSALGKHYRTERKKREEAKHKLEVPTLEEMQNGVEEWLDQDTYDLPGELLDLLENLKVYLESTSKNKKKPDMPF